jgi:hypothetical protein
LGLTCAAPAEVTWLSRDESRQAVLDCFFWQSKNGQPCLEDVAAIESADPSLDHRVVQATLKVEGICAMLMRPIRLDMRSWKSKAVDWRKAVSAETAQPEEGDCFERLDRLKAVAHNQATAI